MLAPGTIEAFGLVMVRTSALVLAAPLFGVALPFSGARLGLIAILSGFFYSVAGAPLPEVNVRLGNVAAEGDTRYESPQEYETKTDAEGRFRFKQVPVGSATLWVHKPGYCGPGLGPLITTPSEDIELSMIQAGRVQVAVDFTATTRPEAYIVEIEPEGGSKIGSWGGSANIDANNQYLFKDVPPGRYILKGRPNPGSEHQQTEPVTIDAASRSTRPSR